MGILATTTATATKVKTTTTFPSSSTTSLLPPPSRYSNDIITTAASTTLKQKQLLANCIVNKNNCSCSLCLSSSSAASLASSSTTTMTTTSLLSSLHASRNSSSSSLSSILSAMTTSTAMAPATAPTETTTGTNSTTEISSYDDDNRTVVDVDAATSNRSTLEQIVPNVIWLEHLLPLLDRKDWNSLMVASKHLYKMTQFANMNVNGTLGNPPWPTEYCFATSGSSQQAIESLTLSYDGEYMACGSVIGTIEIWNRRTGKLCWKKKTTNTNSSSSSSSRNSSSSLLSMMKQNRNDRHRNYLDSYDEQQQQQRQKGRSGIDEGSGLDYVDEQQERQSKPGGNILQFSPIDLTLACGHENRICLWDISSLIVSTTKRGDYNDDDSRINNASTSKAYHQRHVPTTSSSSSSSSYVPTWWNNMKQQQEQQQQQQQQSEQKGRFCQQGNGCIPLQTLYIDNNGGGGSNASGGRNLYEITYIQFSNNSNQLIARYGKMAYIWTKTKSSTSLESSLLCSNEEYKYVITNRIALPSSRCQIVSNPTFSFVAVATNSSSNNTNNSNNNTSTAAKGIIDVWNLQDGINNVDKIKQGSSSNSIGTTKIMAYQKHAIRGLEFVSLSSQQNSSNTNTTTLSSSCCLVSGSLQGEIKIWWITKKKNKTSKSSTATKNNHNNNDRFDANNDENDDDNPLDYVCAYTFQSPGKIFSLSSWSSSVLPLASSNNNNNTTEVYLAAGEARGQIRIWKFDVAIQENEARTTKTRRQYYNYYRRRDDNNDYHHQFSDDDKKLRYHDCYDERVAGIRVRLHKRGNTMCSSSAEARRNKKSSSSSKGTINLNEILVQKVGEHVHFDNIKLLSFVPSSTLTACSNSKPANKNAHDTTAIPPTTRTPPRCIAVSRAYDSRIYFQSIPWN